MFSTTVETFNHKFSKKNTILNNTKCQLGRFNSTANTQREIIARLQVYVNNDFGTSNEEIFEEIKEDILVELLYSDESLRDPIILFRLLRDFLV